MEKKDIEKMREHALAFGAAVRQRTNRQETTMARHGTLPEFIYQRNLMVSERLPIERIGNAYSQDCEEVADTCSSEEWDGDADTEDVCEDEEYDESSDDTEGEEEDCNATEHTETELD